MRNFPYKSLGWHVLKYWSCEYSTYLTHREAKFTCKLCIVFSVKLLPDLRIALGAALAHLFGHINAVAAEIGTHLFGQDLGNGCRTTLGRVATRWARSLIRSFIAIHSQSLFS